jgi:hypothetical protein
MAEEEHDVAVIIMNKNDKVQIGFGELVACIAMPPLRAIEMANDIREAAEAILKSDA